MQSNKVDVLIYMQANNTPELVSSAVTKIGELAGVIKARINPKIKYVLDVQYNPNYVSGGTILNVARKSGCSATLVGL